MRHTKALRAVLEVERKFNPSPRSISLLRQNDGSPRFSQIRYHGTEHLDDTYYDKQGILWEQGIYVRSRKWRESSRIHRSAAGFQWQAKVRRAGDYTNSAFLELEGHDNVLAAIIERSPKLRYMMSLSELPVMARIGSLRETWEADEKFTVVIDSTDFGHVVGEVELESEVENSENSRKDEEAGSVKVRNMDEDIETFMKRYSWAFPMDGEVVGKLTAYFRWAAGETK